MRFVLLSLITLICTSASATYVNPERVNQADFDYACRYVEIFYGGVCGDLAPPRILYSEFRSPRTFWQPSPSLGGMYFPGSTFIVLNANDVSWATRREIAFHESVHYILHWTGVRVDRCQSEEAARRATDVFMKRPYSVLWKLGYGC